MRFWISVILAGHAAARRLLGHRPLDGIQKVLVIHGLAEKIDRTALHGLDVSPDVGMTP